ncbi:UDP-2,3-diacylglucosamine diphosphatase [Coxiella burnetii]|uniref:UDP-2,3-diacylglucosamine diphosphatase n=1 Tax=Coxiella burnetii TaxID=777 RepID=UPI0000ED00C9|nr:UDP-2,3-diacylglucosamine diphosphatase [Coxiella burnetii]EAX31987.1 UDP-2,3-diacylglucosamine diphosphatase [Coxiella burnetii 'MSU Goat Q177']UYK69232.1 UDP-2,3-diacylglucosamine diphosphatase [Coxiella burnetii]
MRHTLFISDLHLEEETPSITAHFLYFLKHQAPKADAIYILGDFFEAWIGDDNQTPFNRKIIESLQTLARTKPTYFMRGNRDFLIGQRFAAMTGVSLLEDPSVIQLYNKPVLLMHGDSLCTLDHKHQAYRRKIMKPWVQKLMLSLPLSLRRKLAKKFREQSRRHNRTLSYEIKDVTPEEVNRVMKEQNVELLIHGHTHRPAIHDSTINGNPTKRIVLGAWHHGGSVLRYAQDGSFELQAFKIDL